MVVAKAIVREDPETISRKTRPSTERFPWPGPRAYLLVLGACLALFGINAILHGFVTACATKADALATQLLAAENEGRELELEIAYLSSYQRITREVETRLAMHRPGPGELRFIASIEPDPSNLADYPPRTVHTGLTAALGNWLRSIGRAAASDR